MPQTIFGERRGADEAPSVGLQKTTASLTKTLDDRCQAGGIYGARLVLLRDAEGQGR
jgi:hypothetical protein